ncbi:MAG: hypothetical protein WC532_05210 [Candidatus Omnitrophota bacterium]
MHKKFIFSGIILFLGICLGVTTSYAENNDFTTGYLCDYAMQLHRQGRTSDAVHQLEIALTIDPGNQLALKYLDKISPGNKRSRKPAGSSQADDYAARLRSMQEVQDVALEREKELQLSVKDKESRLETLSSQLENFKSAMAQKDKELKQIESQLESEKGSLASKEEELSSLLQDKQNEVEQLKKKMLELEGEKRSYENELESLNASLSEKESSRQELTRELESLKGQYAEDLKRNEEDLEKARQDYENRLISLGGQLQVKETLIQKLKDDNAAMLEKGKQERQEQLGRVEKLMGEIEEIFPDKEELKGRTATSYDDIDAKNRQLDRIDRLMKEIEEVLPESDL